MGYGARARATRRRDAGHVGAAPRLALHLDEQWFRREWRSRDWGERRDLRRAALAARRYSSPAMRALVAGYAWRELGRAWTEALIVPILVALIVWRAVTDEWASAISTTIVLTMLSVVSALKRRRLVPALALNLDVAPAPGPPSGT